MPSEWFQRMVVGNEPYIVAEIGSNHNGDMDLARQLIRIAKENGAHAVKFQSWSERSLIAREEYDRNQKYDDSPKKHFGSLREMVHKYYLRPEQHYELKRYCDSINVAFASSPFSKEEVDLLVDVGVPFLKIASMDINNIDLLEHAARQGLPVVLSTGMSTIGEIDAALEVLKRYTKEIVLLHCISIYPPLYEDIHLRNIPMLRETFAFPVGFSDHSIGISIPLAAVALGSCLIEKHFTLDKTMAGWDHEISADPPELAAIARESANIVRALGSSTRIVSEAELQKRAKFRRSIVLARDLKAGDALKQADFLYKRPGTGIHPNEAPYVVGRRLARDLAADSVLRWEDLA